MRRIKMNDKINALYEEIINLRGVEKTKILKDAISFFRHKSDSMREVEFKLLLKNHLKEPDSNINSRIIDENMKDGIKKPLKIVQLS